MAKHWIVEHLEEETYQGAMARQAMERCLRLKQADVIRDNIERRQLGDCTVIENKLGWGLRNADMSTIERVKALDDAAKARSANPRAYAAQKRAAVKKARALRGVTP